MYSPSVFHYCTSALIPTVLLLSLSTQAHAISIGIEDRKFPRLNNVTLYCRNSGAGATYQRALGSDNETAFTSFNYSTVGTSGAKFLITPRSEGRYRCSDGNVFSDAIEVVGEY